MGVTEKNLMTLQYRDLDVDMDNSKDYEKIIKEIAKTSDSIRKKYHVLKTGKMEEDITLESTLNLLSIR